LAAELVRVAARHAVLGETVHGHRDLGERDPIPGPPMVKGAPPFLVPAPLNNRLWHLAFNRVEGLPEKLITGRERDFFGYEFTIQGGKLPDDVIDYYVRLVSNPDALRGSLGFYRALDATLAQNERRATRRLDMPVLAIGGAGSYGAHVGDAMRALANNVQSVVIPNAGHWVAEENPEAFVAALTAFFAPINRDIDTSRSAFV
jgi:pimeloyl-ACP methyl ester carboxylesterase